METKISTLIPARGGSKRIPRKNIRLVNNQPLISWVIKASLSSRVNDTWVSTEDKEIRQISINYGAKVIDRPKELSTDLSTTESVIEHFLNNIDTDIVVLIEPTHPLITERDINNALDIFLEGNYDSLVSLDNQHTFLWEIKDNYAYPINYNPKYRPRTQDFHGFYVENVGLWITTKEAFNKSKVRISGKIGYYICPHVSIDIDEEIDLKIAEVILNETISNR